VKPTAAASAFYQDAVGRLNDVLPPAGTGSPMRPGACPRDRRAHPLGSVIILGYTSLVGSRSARTTLSAPAPSPVIGSLVVLIAYNYPFAGSLAIGTTPYRSGILAQYFPPHP
jgi:hypothetical protein